MSASRAVSGRDFVLTLWTDDPALARDADAAGIDRIGLDLETVGKRERQRGLGTWISPHRIEHLAELRESLTTAKLFARVNPLGPATRREVDRATELGAEVLMLPMFRSAEEVSRFVEIVGGRAAVVLLLETRPATEDVARIAAVSGVQEVHIGVNDLALSLGAQTRFEVLNSEAVARVSSCVRRAGIRFGLGGIGRVGDDSLPIASDLIYAQYARLGATAALVSRAYLRPGTTAAELKEEVSRSRGRLAEWFAASPAELEAAHRAFREAVAGCPTW